MRYFVRLFSLAIVIFTVGVCNGQPSKDVIVVRLALNRPQYRAGEKLKIMVRIANRGSQALVISSLISDIENRQGYVEFQLTRSDGHHERPQLNFVGDTFARLPAQVEWQSILGQWMVLYPGSEIMTHLDLDATIFPSLAKPGRYKLSAIYSSAGLSYPLNYRRVGLTAKDIASLRFSPWSGSVGSNAVSVVVTPK